MRTKKTILIIGITLTCILKGVGIYCYSQTPTAIAHRFMRTINKQNYEKAYTFFYQDKELKQRPKEEITNYMSWYFNKNQLKRITYNNDKTVTSYDNKKVVRYSISYLFENGKIDTYLNVIKDDGWHVVFPFKWSTVEIEAPFGTKIYFNQQHIASSDREFVTVDGILPGSYTVEMHYLNNLYPVYRRQINVPEESVVESPYEVVNLEVKVPKGMTVSLENVQKKSSGENLVFGNIPVGSYGIKVEDEKGYYETIEKTIPLTKNEVLVFDQMTLTQKGIQQTISYLDKFYKDYAKGIKKTDVAVIAKHAPTGKEKWLEDYETWFIDKKQPQNVEVNTEIKEIKQLIHNHIQVAVIEETIFEHNKIAYKVFLGLTLTLMKNEEGYLVMNREINQSIISYRDNSGKWIAY